jgi:hypothetical protein
MITTNRDGTETEVSDRLTRLGLRFGFEPGYRVEYWRGIGSWGEGGEYMAYATQHWTRLGAEWHRRVSPFPGFPGHPKWTVATYFNEDEAGNAYPFITKAIKVIDWFEAVRDASRSLLLAAKTGQHQY